MKIATVSARWAIQATTLLALALLGACSGIPRQEEGAALAKFTPYAGEPVSQFSSFTRFDGWTLVDRDHVLIHTNVNETYLIRVVPACHELPFATRLGVTSRFPNVVSSGFDALRVGRETCRILEIRPVNYKQMKADLAAEKKAARG
jgi:hypothetical protein